MPVTKETVDHVAKLARLEFPEEKKAKLTEQLGNILDYVSKLNELKTDDVAPLTHTLDLETPYREDAVKPSLGLEDALANAPAKEGPYFKVPPIIE
ncbi:MAG: Asp-tRNA(Asn)/Glu-tRNA(Gln) amidotransferase subunit GatC [Nitrospirae bacterium]|nr:Asp-tRNA(Asn)/Glu-tRNA(Gln) amidotransferase subunit GatC [Nitrospirota bacterium]